MRIKERRWYEILDGMAYVYDSGCKKFSQSISVVPISDLQYYRTNFRLTKIWVE